MEDIKPEPLDFVKEFQEYLTQQTQHVNMISGAVCGEKDAEESFQVGATKSDQNGLDPPSVEVSLPLEDNPEVPMDNFERTPDGKYKCSYCNYANKGIARLVEHIRIHTGEKPHRCQLCPFASAYERHLEAHMRSHTGEKPYKCDLCGFCCSDRSNLSHHRRRRHKLLPMRGVRSSFTNKRMLSVLQKRTSSLGFNRRLLINFSPPSMVGQKSPYLNDFSHEMHHQLNGDECKNMAKAHDGSGRGTNGMMIDNPLNQLSTLAGQLANLHPGSQTPTSPDRTSCKEEKPILIQQVTNGVQMSPPTEESHPTGHGDYGLGLSFEHSAHTLSSSVGNSQPGTPGHAAATQDQKLPQKCHHCDIHYFDNILYTIHMGCHGYENPFQCNVCGNVCRDKYDFACHFARGHHHK